MHAKENIMSHSSDVILIDPHEHVRIIRPNRPKKKNALSEELGGSIIGSIEAAAHDDDIGVVGVTSPVFRGR